jgi:signal transduction histidine kinase
MTTPNYTKTELDRFAHDLRTSINHIIGFSDLLIEDIDDEASSLMTRPEIQRINTVGRELREIVNARIGATLEDQTNTTETIHAIYEETHLLVEQLIAWSETVSANVTEVDSMARSLGKINVAAQRILKMLLVGPLDSSAPKEDKRRTTKTLRVVGEEYSDRGYILVVDDNETNRDMLQRWLRREGYGVFLAENATQALAHIDSRKFDAILLDIMMPEVDGLALLDLIRQRYSLVDLPVIMTTAKSQTSDVVTALQRGANDYVTKPIDLPILTARIDTHLHLRRLTKLKDEFLRIASHDMKSPLATILLSGHLLREAVPVGTQMTEETFEMLDFIVMRAEEMQRIIRDFIDFQAGEDGKLKLQRDMVDLNMIARTVIAMNRQYANGKNITLTPNLDESVPLISVDAARLQQVIQNYLNNAIKFSQSGTHIVVLTEQDESNIYLKVTDQGPGLTPNDLANVFSTYARLSNKPTGSEHSSGLGLSICRQLIELHQGQVGVYNNDDQPGATFWFSVPIASPVA